MRSNPTRRQALRLAGVAGAALAAPALAQAPWPNKPVRFVVPFPPGQAADIFARLIAEKLTDVWKQQVVVENKAGGSGIPATEYGKNAAPDGYTLMIVSSGTFGVNPSLYPDLPYRPLVDFLPITNIFLVPLVIVAHPSFQANTLAELIELARKEPGQLSYASAGPGTSQHLSMELFKMRARLDIVHIPYKGIGQGVSDLISGVIPMFSANATAQILDLARAGKVRILSVNAAERIKAAPEIPTSTEAGLPGMVAQTTFAIFAPAGTPAAIVDRLDAATQKVMADEDFQKQLLNLGFEPVRGVGGEKATAVFEDELVRWTPILKAGAVKPE
jgi:tripartite-type tricarboxylate transporter receptor subunit TctC